MDTPQWLDEIIADADELAKKYHVDKLIPGLVRLAKSVGQALEDGNLSPLEVFRIARQLVALVASARK